MTDHEVRGDIGDDPPVAAPRASDVPPRGVTVRAWVQQQVPDSEFVSASEPEPVLLGHNAVAVAHDNETIREVVLAWERILPEDGAVGFLALGTPPERRAAVHQHEERGADGVMAHAGKRIVRGSIPGAIFGAVVVTAVVAAVVGWSTALIGAALGGAAFGFVAGFMISFATGTAWGAAYRDSFVDDERTDLLVASIHSDVSAPIADAVDAVTGIDRIELYSVDRTGSTSRLR